MGKCEQEEQESVPGGATTEDEIGDEELQVRHASLHEAEEATPGASMAQEDIADLYSKRLDRPGRSFDLSYQERMQLKSEEEAAREAGLRWQERGPPGPKDGGPSHWRGQEWRSGANGGAKRWGNRGGRWKEYYTMLARSGKLRQTLPGGSGRAGGAARS